MCGRYASSRRPEDLREEFEIDKVEVPEPLPADYNVAPTKKVYAVVERAPRPQGDGQGGGDGQAEGEGQAEGGGGEDGKGTRAGSGPGRPERQLRAVTWGLVPFWAKDPAIGNKMINARMETVHEKPAYRQAFRSRRCLLPADGYYEWYPTEQRTKAGKPVKQPFFIHPADGGVMAMAGLYEIWRDPTRDEDDPERFRWTCTVLTTTAEDAVGHIHDRMPLLVERERWAEWLDPTGAGGSSGEDLRRLLVPAAPGRLEAYPVSTAVNNVRNNGEELLEPLATEPLAPAEKTTDRATDRP